MEKINSKDLKILEYIIENNGVKQAEISELFDIDRGNLSRKCNYFKTINILDKDHQLKFNNLLIKTLIFEIKHSAVRYFIVDTFGEPLSEFIVKEFTTKAELQSAIITIFQTMETNSYDVVGCIVHGLVKNCKIINLGDIDISDFPIKEFLKTLTLKPIYLENFANVATLSHYLTSSNELHSLFYLKIAPSLGAGLIYHKEIFHGFSGAAMEPAWMLFESDTKDNKFFDHVEEELLKSSKYYDNPKFEAYIDFLDHILTNISSIIDPEVIIIDSQLIQANPSILFRFNQENIMLSSIPRNDCYKSLSKLILRGEYEINYNRIVKKEE